VSPPIRHRRLEWIGTAIVFLAALRYWLWYYNRSTNLLDEGSTAAQALRILNGEVIYRDFFTVVTPASYFTVAGLFQLFGEQLIVLRWAAVACGLAVLLVTLTIGRRVAAWPFAAAAGLLTTVWGWFLGTPNFYSLQAALCALIALWCYLRDVERPHPKWVVLAGAFAGLAALTKQNVGAYAAAGLLLSIWLSALFDQSLDARGRLRRSGLLIAGVAAPFVPALLYLLIAGAGPYLYESWIYYPLAKYPERFALPFPALYPILPEHGVLTLRDAMAALATGRVPEPAVFDIWVKLVLYLPVLVYPLTAAVLAWLAYRCHRRRDADAWREGRMLIAIAVTGALLLLQTWPRADLTHLLFGMQPTFVLFGYLTFFAWRAMRRLPGPRTAVSAALLVVTLAPHALLLWNGYRRTDWEYANYVAWLETGRGQGIRAVPIEANRIDTVTRYLAEHTAPDEPIFVVPWAAGFYFLADRANPTRTDFMLFEDPDAYPCLLWRLEQNPPTYVVYGYTWDVDERRFRDYAAPVDQYIRSRYAIESSVDGYEIWRRIDGAPGASRPFPGACEPKRFRWRDLFGPSLPGPAGGGAR
jgi:hypothetical protein